MTNRLKSKYKRTKKLPNVYKNLWANSRKDFCRSLLKIRRKKTSFYGKLLLVKQSLKLFYSNIKEKSFKKYLYLAVKSPSKTIDKLISSLERRLDSVLFRSVFAFSFFDARQLINHGWVSINGITSYLPKKKLYKGDLICLKKTMKSLFLFQFFVATRSVPNYIEIDFRCLAVIFLWDANLLNVYYPINCNYSLIPKLYR